MWALLERRKFCECVRSRSVSPNVASSSSIKTVKFSKRGDEVLIKGANHACASPERSVTTSPTLEKSLVYCWGCNRMISQIWLIKPRRYALVSLNLSGKLMVGSRTCGWEEDVVGLGADGGCDSVGGGFLKVPACNSRNDSRRISFSS